MNLKKLLAAGCAVFAMCMANAETSTGAKPLPDGYAPADWIKGDGETSDVSLDFIPNPQTDKVVIKLAITKGAHKMFAFSAREDSKVAAWSLNLVADASSGNYLLRLDYASEQVQQTTKPLLAPETVYTCTLDRNELTCSNGKTVKATEVPGFDAAGGNLHLFCTPGNTTSVGDFRLYSFQIYRNDVLIHDLVPAFDANGKPVLVDVEGSLSVTMKGTFTASGEESRVDAIMALYDQVNPVVDKNGRKFISLAYITDTHKCKRVSGDTDATNPVTDYYYHDADGNPLLTDPEPSIRLLGKVAKGAAFDALIHAGDFSTAITKVPFGEGDYLNEIRNVKAMVSTHLPDTPFFAVDGNHDRNYWNSDHTSGHSMTDAEWAAALAEIDTDVSDNAQIVRTALTGNSYALDFKRCLANGKNVRLVLASIYDANGGSDPAARLNEGLVFADASVNEFNTVVGVTAHAYRDAFGTAAKAYLDRNVGVSFFGAITGHSHEAATAPISGTGTDRITVKNAFAAYGDMTGAACHFAIFVFDTEANKMYEIRLSGEGQNVPQLLEHPIAVSTGSEVSDHELLAIRGDGSAFLTTDFYPNPQTDKIVVQLALPDAPAASTFAFSAQAADGSGSYSLNLGPDGYRFDYGGTGIPKGALEKDVLYTFTAENNVLTWSGGEGTVATKDESFVRTGGPLCLFRSETGTQAASTMRLYSLKIFRSGQLIHDLQPYFSATVGATLVDKVTGGDPIALTKEGGDFFPIEMSPHPSREARKLAWIQCDGKTGYFMTDFIPDPSRDTMEAELTLMDDKETQFVFSARKMTGTTASDSWAVLLRCGDNPKTTIRYDYKVKGANTTCSYSKGERVVFTADKRKLTWTGGGAGITSSQALFGPAGGFLWLLGGDGGDSGLSNPSSARLHSFLVWRDGLLIHKFLPTLLPSGEATLMDYAAHPAAVVRRGAVSGGPQLPVKGLVVVVR